MANTKFEIKGVKETLKMLKTLDAKVAKKVSRSAMRKGMKVIKNQVKENAPVDSGALKDSVKIKAGKRSRNKISIEVVIGDGLGKGDTYYAAAVELGHGDTPPNPFIRNTFAEKGQEAADITIETIANGVIQVAKEG